MYDLFFRISDSTRITKASLLTTGYTEEQLSDLDFLKSAGYYPITNIIPYYDERYQRIVDSALQGDVGTGFYIEHVVGEVDAETYQANLAIAKEVKNTEIVDRNNSIFNVEKNYYLESTTANFDEELRAAIAYLAGDEDYNYYYFDAMFANRLDETKEEFANKIILKDAHHKENMQSLSIHAAEYQLRKSQATTFTELDSINVVFNLIHTRGK